MTVQELNERKKALGYTAEQVTKLSGVPLGTVQKILSGQTRSPRYDTMQKLEQVLNRETEPGMLRETGTSYRVRQENEQPGRCTLEDFHALPEGTRAELLDGVIYVLEAPGTAHQVIALQMGHMLEAYIDANGGSCVPFLAPVDVRFADDAQEVLEPDLVMVCDRNKIHKKEILGAPDLVVEILSPSNTMKRMLIKRNRYLKNRVREYWEIDPEDKSITVMALVSESEPTSEPKSKPKAEPESGAEPETKSEPKTLSAGGSRMGDSDAEGQPSRLIYTTQVYSFADCVPVAVWGGACKINFPRISRRLEALSLG